MTTTLSQCHCATRAHQQWRQAWDELHSSTVSILCSLEGFWKRDTMVQYRLALPRELHRSRLINLARGPDPHDQECEAGKRPSTPERTKAGGIYQFLLQHTQNLCGTDHEAALQFHLAVYSDWYDECSESDDEDLRHHWQIITQTRRIIKAYRSVQNGKLNGEHRVTVFNVIEEQLRTFEWGSENHQYVGKLRQALLGETRFCACMAFGVLIILQLNAAAQQRMWVALPSHPWPHGVTIAHDSHSIP